MPFESYLNDALLFAAVSLALVLIALVARSPARHTMLGMLVVVAVGVLGFAYEEVAELLGCSTGTIKSRVSRARIALMKAVRPRAGARRRLIPASPQAFAGWLADLEAIRIAARARLAGEAPVDAKLPPLRKIALKSAAAAASLRVHTGGGQRVQQSSFTAAAAAAA